VESGYLVLNAWWEVAGDELGKGEGEKRREEGCG